MKTYAILPFLLLALNCREAKNTQVKQVKGLITQNAMVVSARKEASEIGSYILKNGGNAFDAMMGTELALAVSYPYAGNLGGGGFMVYRLKNGESGALDYREKAPLAATTHMYLDTNNKVVPNASTQGALAIGVPGTIAGVFEAHEKYGTLPIDSIIKPVISLAKNGVIVTEKQARRLNYFKTKFTEVNKKPILFDKNWKVGDTIKNTKLAQTLSRIMKNGKNEFYAGETAQILVKHIQDNGGIFTLEDLKKYTPKWRTPITFSYDDLNIISMPPPSSGGICLAQIMKMIEPYNLHEFEHNSTKYLQVITEAERRSYADRSYFLGDPDFVNVPVNDLINQNYLDDRMASFSFESATPSSNVSHGNIQIVESNETTHYSIVDTHGNAVSVTTTLNGAYGSKLFCSELGFFLNNEMDDFSIKPNTPNMFGLIGAEANKILPEKRMLSSMTPTIIEKNNKLYMVVGSPGGSTIITTVLQTILNVHEHKMGMQEAVNARRFHHQWLPDEIRLESNTIDSVSYKQLTKLGYKLNYKAGPVIGKVNSILVLENSTLEAGADPRGDEAAIGF